MKYQVTYKNPKNKKGFYSDQKAVFLDVSDAILWQEHVKNQGAIDVEMVVDFS
jgi:hypothetical protein